MKVKKNPVDSQRQIHFEANDVAKALYGSQNCNLKRLEAVSGVQINVRGNVATLSGDTKAVALASDVLEVLYHRVNDGGSLEPSDIDSTMDIISHGGRNKLKEVDLQVIKLNGTSKNIKPKGISQTKYLQAIDKNDIVFGIGPAGTGKTYLAIAKAVEAFLHKTVRRIVLTRPAVEAGEKLGFLPGNLVEKVDPYLRPVYDALHDMMDVEKVNRLIERGEIEVAPLAFMRGRTLDHSFIILDEAQNTSSEQMKMFLTRIGQNSKAVITGDITQIDLPIGQKSGLVEAKGLLRDIDGISFSFFSEKDVVRHRLVREIIKAYENVNRES